MRELSVLLPEWDEPPLRLAESLRRDGSRAEAEAAYSAVLEINPRREEALVAKAALLVQRGEAAGAQTLLLRCLGLNPARAEAWDLLGIALGATGDADAAETAFAEALRLAPSDIGVALRMAEAAVKAGSAEPALAVLDLASEADPLNAALHGARGFLLERMGRRPEAIDALEAAAALAPDAAPLWLSFGTLLAQAGRLSQAETAMRRAMALAPDSRGARNGYAVVLMRMQRHAAAHAELAALIADSGPDVAVLGNIALSLVHLGRQAEGEAAAREALALEPGGLGGARALANALPYRDGIGGAELLEAMRRCAEALPHGGVEPFACDPAPERRLRVGLLSGCFRVHPVAWLTVAGFEALDRDRFKFVCLAQRDETDFMARRFRALAAEWHDVGALDDAALARLARERKIDVLIDLGGYGDAGRISACALRLAPVQVKWVGMQTHSTGLPEIDWFITDRWETPDGFERFYSERLLRLADGYVCYSPPGYAPDVGPLPAAASGAVTFGCFNNLAKVTPRTIEVWAGILRRVPDARLVLKTHQLSEPETAERVRADFAGHGIDVGQLELRGASGHRVLLAEYGQIDIVLDPFPYSGGLTTCEALWMGVPTITLPGETFASRHATSHISNVGLADWVARDLSHYADLAVVKAADLGALASLRAGLRARVKASALCDAPRFGRGFDAALRHAWRAWCAERRAADPR